LRRLAHICTVAFRLKICRRNREEPNSPIGSLVAVFLPLLLQKTVVMGSFPEHLDAAFGAPLFLAGDASCVGDLMVAFRADAGSAFSHVVSA
jgi:hypothetical protein